MKRRIKAVIWILMAALALGGCSLAREDATGSTDRFVGVNAVLRRLEGGYAYEMEREYELDGSESYLALIEETDELATRSGLSARGRYALRRVQSGRRGRRRGQ